MAKRIYIINTYCKLWNMDEPAWKQRFCTKHELLGTLANGFDYSDSMLNNLVQSPDDVSGEYKNRKYYISKQTTNGTVKINLTELLCDLHPYIMNVQQQRKQSAIKRKQRNWELNNYTFRVDPVPNVHKCNSKYYRNVHRISNIRKLTDAEYKEFAKPKNIEPIIWDDRPRIRSKSWKDSCKVRKQWMKKIRQ